MLYQEAELVESFQTFIKKAERGATIPPVNPHELKCLHQLCVEKAKRYCGKDGILSLDSMARACSHKANLPAVWLRHTQLRGFHRQGLLSPWQHGTALDDAVFEVAATAPMKGIQLDPESFLREVRQRTCSEREP